MFFLHSKAGVPLAAASEDHRDSNLSQPPKNHRVVRIEIPLVVRIESLVQEEVPGWDAEDAGASRIYGDEWIVPRTTPVLRVPSVITQGVNDVDDRRRTAFQFLCSERIAFLPK
jgi:RES domain-containing protein